MDEIMYYLKLAALMAVMAPVFLMLITCLHETGHLLGGLVSGYRLSSITFFSLSLCRLEDGKFAFKRNNKMLGQCILCADKLNTDPRLLIMGGGLVNLITGTAALVAEAVLWPQSIYAGAVCTEFGILSVIIGISNLKPDAKRRNDGDSLREVKRGGYNVRLYNCLMLISDSVMNGHTLLETDRKLFERHPIRHGTLSGEMALLKYLRAQEMCFEDAETFGQAETHHQKCFNKYYDDCMKLKDYACGLEAESEIRDILFGEKSEHDDSLQMDEDRKILAKGAIFIKSKMIGSTDGIIWRAMERQTNDVYGGLYKASLKTLAKYSRLRAERNNT